MLHKLPRGARDSRLLFLPRKPLHGGAIRARPPALKYLPAASVLFVPASREDPKVKKKARERRAGAERSLSLSLPPLANYLIC